MHKVPFEVAIIIEILTIIGAFFIPTLWIYVIINGLLIIIPIVVRVYKRNNELIKMKKKYQMEYSFYDNYEKKDKIENSLKVNQPQKYLKILALIIIVISIFFSAIGIGMLYFINKANNIVESTYEIENKEILDYLGDWVYIKIDENIYSNGVLGVNVTQYVLIIEYNNEYPSPTFHLTKKIDFHKKLNNELYEVESSNTKYELARGILVSDNNNIILYFGNIDFEKENFKGVFKDATAVSDYGFRYKDATRVLVTNQDSNKLVIYTPDDEIEFERF